MDFHHRLTRKAIDIAVTKILNDMKTNTRRSVRNLVDLGALFSGSENQKTFFADAKKVLSNPNNPYNDFAYRIVSEVDNETVKTVGLNLGYSSLIFGADRLRKKQTALGNPIPWILVNNVEKPQLQSLPAIESLIDDGRALGIFSHIFRLHNSEDIICLMQIAEHFEECFFVLDAPASLIDSTGASAVSQAHNVLFSIRPSDNDAFSDETENAFNILKRARCLYGFSVLYDDENTRLITSEQYISHAITRGAAFIVYVPAVGASPGCQRDMYAFVQKTRGADGSPVIPLEWRQDMRVVSERIKSSGALMKVDTAGFSSLRQCLTGALENPLTR